MIGPLTYLDAGLITLVIISGLLATYRGFAREVLSILSWIIAGAATFFFVTSQKAFAQEMATQMGAPVAVAQIAIGAVLFLVVLIVVHLITARISDAMLDSAVGPIDRILGFLFGAVRAYLIVLIGFMFARFFVPDYMAKTDWVSRSVSRPMLESSAAWLNPLLQSFGDKINTKAQGEQQG